MGPMEFDNKYVYEGQWYNGQKAGRGRQLWRDGSYYEGYWASNMASGYGRLVHTDGDTYEGEWIEDRADGHGKKNSYRRSIQSYVWSSFQREMEER
jgi:hypothetical protein